MAILLIWDCFNSLRLGRNLHEEQSDRICPQLGLKICPLLFFLCSPLSSPPHPENTLVLSCNLWISPINIVLSLSHPFSYWFITKTNQNNVTIYFSHKLVYFDLEFKVDLMCRTRQTACHRHSIDSIGSVFASRYLIASRVKHT